MKTRKEIIENWLPRYTGLDLEDFGHYILLTNFKKYLDFFQKNIMLLLSMRMSPCHVLHMEVLP